MSRLAAVITAFRTFREPMTTPAVQLQLAAEFGALRNEIEEMRRVLNYQRGMLDFLMSQRDASSSPKAHDDAVSGHKVH
jgi:hypothetical protein